MNMEEVYISLKVMGAGMTGIFATLSILYVFIILLVKTFPLKKSQSPTEE
ncbi:OadG-related small transporter subunit [Alkaliphilus hydrothermalis]|uniref:Oxaloacetate decarboxylase, gamma chain n=1 Tax=Alkaliphilus hydrothermalis TaxID=1482730 RepID=A0ABS2NLF9_9FIRM|nr:OadG-related small transporter subunit [Alkaliphilus hydrothermalis]MBM7613758.1 hypothetical protein [Alkaliphilus hydrothermalis]